MFARYKKIITIIIVLILAFIAYSFWQKDDPADSESLVRTQPTNIDVLGQDIIRVLNRIDDIDLDRSVFEDPVYKSLIDSSRPILPEPVGRNNPFLPYSKTVPQTSTSTRTSGN